LAQPNHWQATETAMMPSDYLERVQRTLSGFRQLGERTLSDGTMLIGHVPHVAPEAWLHAQFPPLREDQLREVEAAVGRSIPPGFAAFLLEMNGLSLFSDALSIYGLRSNFSRAPDAVWQPYSIATPNTFERPVDAPTAAVFVGGFDYDGSLLYIDAPRSVVHRCSRDSAKPLNTWSTFSKMLTSETERIAKLFDATGRQIDPDVPTCPDPVV
jgi:hypothetical protein